MRPRERGIHVIYQEFVLFPELSVWENISAGQEIASRLGIINRRAAKRRAREVLARLGTEIDVDALVRDLSVADQQMVEIAKSLASDAKLLVLDEPTAVISGHEVELLFDAVRNLKAHGVPVIYISHRLEEIFEIADRATVLKDGKLVATKRVSELDRPALVSMMVGRELKDIYPPKTSQVGDVVLDVSGLSVTNHVEDATFTLKRGEILGLAGMVGSGRSELAHGIFGSLPRTAGKVSIGGQPLDKPTPRRSIEAGIGFLTEDRKREGLVLSMSLAANITMPTLKSLSRHGFVNFAEEQRLARAEIDKYSIAARSPDVEVVNLSGGNQQKTLFSRWLIIDGKVLILDEPTRGVDVGAKVEIYRIIRTLADEGIAILMISSELPEIVGMCDRVIVMREGVITGELAGAAIDEEAIMHLATLHEATGAVAHAG